MILDDWDSDGPTDAWTRWGWGCAAPLVASLYAASIILSGEARLIGLRNRSSHFTFTDAILLATAALGVAAVLHARNFWPETRSLARWAPAGQFVGLAAIGGSLLALAYRVLLLQKLAAPPLCQASSRTRATTSEISSC